jgi:hypothetical protein
MAKTLFGDIPIVAFFAIVTAVSGVFIARPKDLRA